MARSNAERQLGILKRYRLPLEEWAILRQVGYGPIPERAIAHTAAAESTESPHEVLSKAKCEKGLSSCMKKGLVRVVDDAALQEIGAYLRRKPAPGPIYGLPQCGDVDFTWEGAKLYLQVRKDLLGPSWAADFSYRREIYSKEEWYCRTKQGARKALDELGERDNVASISETIPIGRWRVYWWEAYPKGYVTQVESKRT